MWIKQIHKSVRVPVVVVVSIMIGLMVGVSIYAAIISPGSIDVYYSLDKKNNDKELVKVIDKADKYVYFAIYYFTNQNISNSLIAAKRRGLEVIGIMDREASMNANRTIMERLQASGINVLTQKHMEGIMHMKVLVTEHAYATGSYNWTDSATRLNDEVLEIGTNNSVRKKYLEIIKKVLQINGSSVTGKSTASQGSSQPLGDGQYSIEEAIDHVGENATVVGTVSKIFTSKSGTIFLDFCEDFKKCPFSAVIFASDAAKFKDLDKYKKEVRLTGLIKSYQGKAEIILDGPEQIE